MADRDRKVSFFQQISRWWNVHSVGQETFIKCTLWFRQKWRKRQHSVWFCVGPRGVRSPVSRTRSTRSHCSEARLQFRTGASSSVRSRTEWTAASARIKAPSPSLSREMVNGSLWVHVLVIQNNAGWVLLLTYELFLPCWGQKSWLHGKLGMCFSYSPARWVETFCSLENYLPPPSEKITEPVLLDRQLKCVFVFSSAKQRKYSTNDSASSSARLNETKFTRQWRQWSLDRNPSDQQTTRAIQVCKNSFWCLSFCLNIRKFQSKTRKEILLSQYRGTFPPFWSSNSWSFLSATLPVWVCCQAFSLSIFLTFPCNR